MDRILIVEDDEDINRLLCKILTKDGYEVTGAYSGTEAKLLLDQEKWDLMLLDLMLPGMKGEELTDYVRNVKHSEIPILILSAKTAVEHKLALIAGGADDYITKPFEPKEVSVRVMAALRRYQKFENTEGKSGKKEKILRRKHLALDTEARSASVNGKELALTRYEYEILLCLISQPEKVFSRETLYETVWNGSYYGEDNTVNVHVSNLRKKIAAYDPVEEYIKTVWGIGFKMA